MRRVNVAVIAGIMLVWGSVPAMATLKPVMVVGGSGEQYWPSSNGTYLAWTNSAHNRLNVYVMELPSGTGDRVNALGTRAAAASFVGSSNVLVYAQWTAGSPGDIYFYDVSTGTRTRAPAAVNKPRTFEWAPAASANYLLFVRDKWSDAGKLLKRWLLLYDRNSAEMTTLGTGVSSRYLPSFAGTTYAAWTVVAPSGNTVHYWSAAGGKQLQPSVPGRDQYSPWIDETTGQVYYVRARPLVCGRSVTIRRSMLGSSESTVLASLPPTIDVGWNLSVAANFVTKAQTLYFERWSCEAETGDIYAIAGVDTI